MWQTLVCLSTLFIVSTHGLYSPSDDVVELTDANFDRLVTQSDALWVVEFYAPWCGHCVQFSSEYKKAATALKGIVKVGGVNCDDQKSVCGQYGIRGFPTVKFFGVKSTPTDYNGQRSASALVDSALAEVKNKVKDRLSGGGSKSSGGGRSSGSGSGKDDVIELTDSNFDKLVLDSDEPWLVEFFAPWCGHCKKLEPEWKQAASELKGKVKLGALDATVHQSKAAEYGIQGYPTIKFFPAGKKGRHSAQEYDGGRDASGIVTWALNQYTANLPPPEILEVISSEVYQECTEKSLCVISFLPHILDCDSTCRNTYLKLLQDLGDKYKTNNWGWLWAEAGAQYDLEQSLDIGGFGYPAMAVLNQRKHVYSVLRGSYSNEGISSYLRDIMGGRGVTLTSKAEPKINNIEPWDGKDGEMPPEEDWDLSDVDLDEDEKSGKDEL